MHIYRIQKNPYSSGVYNFQTKRGRFIQIESQFSSNPKWKNRYFFISGQWEFTPKEKADGPRVGVAKQVPIHDPIRPAGTRYTIRLYPDTTCLTKRVIGFDTIMTRK
jgi:hypothetical protein